MHSFHFNMDVRDINSITNSRESSESLHDKTCNCACARRDHAGAKVFAPARDAHLAAHPPHARSDLKRRINHALT
jgi:hypothetical protein